MGICEHCRTTLLLDAQLIVASLGMMARRTHHLLNLLLLAFLYDMRTEGISQIVQK